MHSKRRSLRQQLIGTPQRKKATKRGWMKQQNARRLFALKPGTAAAKQMIWNSVGGWKTSYTDYAKKHK